MTVLEVDAILTRYGGIVAIDDITRTIPAHGMVAIIGANGAGKTTLLNSIAGLLRSDRGRITFDGIDLRKLRAHQVARHGITQVPEGRQILGPLSVGENLRF